MSLLKKIFSAPPPPAPAAPMPAADAGSMRKPEQPALLDGPEARQIAAIRAEIGCRDAGELLPCSGIDWNAEAQLRFADTAMARWKDEASAVAGIDPSLGALDAAVLYAAVSELLPTRIIEVGCGHTTVQIRRAMKARHMAAELIAIDPEPRCDIGEHVDAHLAQPVQEIPLSDFEMLQAGEMLVLDTTHVFVPGGEVDFLFSRVLPRLNAGVVVGVRGVRLPRAHSADEMRRGFGEQTLLQAYLAGNARTEILFSGGWLGEHHGARLREHVPRAAEGERCSWLWFRAKQR